MANLKNNSCFSGDNSSFIEDIYQRYLQGDKSVGKDWSDIFANGQQNTEVLSKPSNYYTNDLVLKLVNFFRSYGHFFAKLNPLSSSESQEINYKKYSDLENIDLNLLVNVNGLLNRQEITIEEFISLLKNIYCKNIGFEFMHISSQEERLWLQNKIENRTYELSVQDKKEILRHLIESEMFEQFLHMKFTGYKRFSIEGGESAIIAIERIIKDSVTSGIEEIVLGMAHRGRLNILAKIAGKEYTAILSEFQGNFTYSNNLNISGDVKYHLGHSCDRVFSDGQKIHLSLCYNPSHLEAINPVLVGRVRAKQKIKSTLGISIHGDAAFIGQGVVAETLSLSNIEGYKVGGIIHIVINNQIGFTANPDCARTSFYCTDIAKFIEAPVFHVNGDDQESVSLVTSLALEYKQKFKKDVIIDLICYRKYGHNEGDEPNFTQPLMYQLISQHKTPGRLYEDQLIKNGVLSSDDANSLRNEFRSMLDNSLAQSGNFIPKVKDDYPKRLNRDYFISKEKLKTLGVSINNGVPDDFNLNKKVKKILSNRLENIVSESNIDWATAESLAFGSLLTEGIAVRLSGQDSGRGTFSQRHARLIDQTTEEVFIPLNNISQEQEYFEVIDSPLSEYAVMGFEYGYSLESKNSLVLWEGQFGDFANGAQIVIDQFISSAETKWLLSSALVLLLPHGYEGQGPEHSSARIERFLQLCAEDNMRVVNCSTPANYFHVLRRQVYRDLSKPLILFTPKSLLRHKKAVSSLLDFAGEFCEVMPEHRMGLVSDENIRKVVICSGKIYYDIIEEFECKKVIDIAVLRLEQFYPLPFDKLSNELKKYKNARVVWCQEEPKNMGGWFFVSEFIEEVLSHLNSKIKRPECVSRPKAASPACGHSSTHVNQQREILMRLLDIS